MVDVGDYSVGVAQGLTADIREVKLLDVTMCVASCSAA
jgi:hypothetical protein